MTWQCKLLNIVGERLVRWKPPPGGGVSGEIRLLDSSGIEHSYKDLLIGTLFFVPKDCNYHEWPWYLGKDQHLSDYYKQHNSHRQPLFVILPCRHLFNIDGKCWSNGKEYGGWQVSGDAPNVTVNPSINIGGQYHGWIKNGVISDDCEGRKF